LEKLDAEDLERLNEICDEGFKWIDDHPNEERDSYEDKLNQVEMAALPILGEARSDTMPAVRSYIDDL
jgi:hypothetical protein